MDTGKEDQGREENNTDPEARFSELFKQTYFMPKDMAVVLLWTTKYAFTIWKNIGVLEY